MIPEEIIITAIFTGIVSILGVTFKHIKSSHCWTNDSCCNCSSSNTDDIIIIPHHSRQSSRRQLHKTTRETLTVQPTESLTNTSSEPANIKDTLKTHEPTPHGFIETDV